MSINMRFTEEDWQRHEQTWKAWWAGELDRPTVIIQGFEARSTAPLPDAPGFAAHLGMDMPADEVIDRYQAHLEATVFYADAWPKWWPNFGPGILAGFIGANVHVTPETIWFEPADRSPIDRLRIGHDADSVWYRRIRQLTETAVRRWGRNVSVGHTDLGGNLDILASLRTTGQLLLDLYDSPEQVARLAGEITRLWIRYYDELDAIIRPSGRGTTPWAPIWSPGRCYMLQSDFCYMISPQMFERFVLPDLAACCDRLDHGFYHLDGKGQLPHLDMLLSIKRLAGVQWIPGDGQPPPEKWLDVLKRIRDAGKLCQLFVDPEGAIRIARELGAEGFALMVWMQDPTPRKVKEFQAALRTRR